MYGISLLGRLGRLVGMRGLWEYLSVRATVRAEIEKDRIALEKDRERNLAFANYFARLEAGTEVTDYEDGTGRKFTARKTYCSPQCPNAPQSATTVIAEDIVSVTEIASADRGHAGEITP